MNSAGSSGMREIESVETLVLVYVGKLLRMGDDSLLLPKCKSVGDRVTGKGESDVCVVRKST